MSSESRWEGVRPLRYREEVFRVLKSLAKEDLSLEDLRLILLQEREAREGLRLRPLLIRRTIQNKSRSRAEFLTKAEQIVRVFVRLGLARRSGDMIQATPAASRIAKMIDQDELVGQTSFLETLLNSPYTTYAKFLKALSVRKLSIPSSFTERDKVLSDFLRSEGFPMDSWSFFIIRDLFYDFDLLNYTLDQESERLFPLFNIGANDGMFSQSLLIGSHRLNYWRAMSVSSFVSCLVENYMTLAGGWNRIVDLVRLREKVSEDGKLSERQFNILLMASVEHPSEGYQIIPSVGRLRPKRRSGYLTKALTLPKHSNGQPYTLIRIERSKLG